MSIREIRPRVWEVRKTHGHREDGRPRTLYKTVHGSHADAVAAEAALTAQMAAEPTLGRGTTLRAVWGAYSGSRGQRLAPKTLSVYTWVMGRYWLPRMGDVDVSAITRAAVQRELLGSGWSRATAIRNRRVLSTVLTWAVNEGWLRENPIRVGGFEYPQADEPDYDADPFAAIDGRGRDGAGVQAVVQCVNLIGEALRDEGVLSCLRSSEVLHVGFLTQTGNLVVLLVNLVLTQPVDDALGACGLAGDDVADAIGEGCTVGAVLGEDGSGLLGVAELDVGRELGGLHLDAVEALHHAHVGRVEALIDGVLRRAEAVAEGHLEVTAALAELGREALALRLDALKRGLNHLVTEATVDLVRVVEPRVKLVAADAASAVAVATVAVEAAEQDEQQQNPSLLS